MVLNVDNSDELDKYIRAGDKLEELAVHLIAHGVDKLESENIKNNDYLLNELFSACYFALNKSGLLLNEQDCLHTNINWSAVKSLKELAVIKQECLQLSSGIEGHVKLLLHCAGHLPAVLAGRINGLEVLFPRGSATLVSGAYRGNILQDNLNKRIAEDIVQSVSVRSGNVKVLEVGAGTCATTAVVLQALNQFDNPPEVLITDISPSLVNEAKQNFSEMYPFTHYSVLDVEIKHHERFDIIYASNVLHATKDINVVLKNLFDLMNDGGKLIINELLAFSAYTTITFGLTSGWWLFDDKMRIDHSPLLDANRWKEVLSNAGFVNVEFNFLEVNNSKYRQQVLISCECSVQ
ncbi:class I SAM-dependent methyltransferase [Photobacterium frigidiphilum]|uniref:class I SAM-dependent methyltransferase n=1 Tax=Photobacterium frigidiphilum TaxID=264736 RepID=UPI003D0D3FB7